MASTPRQAEALAMLLATRMAVNQKWKNVTIFYDAQQVVQTATRKQRSPWEITGILLNLYSFKPHFENWEVKRISIAMF